MFPIVKEYNKKRSNLYQFHTQLAEIEGDRLQCVLQVSYQRMAILVKRFHPFVHKSFLFTSMATPTRFIRGFTAYTIWDIIFRKTK